MENEVNVCEHKCKDSESTLKPVTYFSTQFEVLFNDVILHRLFCCLDHKSLQSCRIVCKKWKNVAEPIFKDGSRVLFDFNEERNPSGSQSHLRLHNSIMKTCSTVTKLIEIFGGIPLEIPFTAFRLKGHVPLTIPVLGNIFHCYGESLKDILFDNVTFPKNIGDPLDITELIPSTTVKLNVDCSKGYKLIISQNRLLTLKCLKLIGCILNLNCFEKISPLEIELNNTWCILDEERVDSVFVNELMDLQCTRKLKLTGDSHILDLSGKKIFNVVQLSDTKMLHWRNYNCTVGKLILHGVPFLTKNQMKIKELIFSASSVDLSVLPTTLERLSLKSADIKCSENCLCLPNLKYLQLEDTNNESSCISHFLNCPNLDDIKLESTYGRIGLSFNNIPRNLLKLHLTQVNVTGNGNHRLNKLILQNYDFQIMFNVLQKLHPDHLVVSISDIHLNYLKILKFLMQKSFKSLSVGKFMWQECDKNDRCHSPVEMIAKCYLFENGKQKILEETEFDKLLISN